MSTTASALADVLRHPGVWRRSAPAASVQRTQPTHFAGLDALLPGGGWAIGAVNELLIAHDGIGELALVMPALAELTRRRQRVVFVAPPYIPYAPALREHGIDLAQVTQIDTPAADGSWSAEQCLRSGGCGAVLCWLPKADYAQLRRMQLAAESGGTLGFVFRPAGSAAAASPSALRLRIDVDADGATDIEVLKCRGGFDARRAARLRWRA